MPFEIRERCPSVSTILRLPQPYQEVKSQIEREAQ